MKEKVFLLVTTVFSIFLISCASVPKEVKTNPNVSISAVAEITEPLPPPPEDEGTKIKVPVKKERSYFDGISKEIVLQIENGSPTSIKSAVSKLKKATLEYNENEKVLLNIASFIMQTVWPSETVDWESPTVSEKTPYLGAIDSVKNGVYDLSTGNVDFLATLLPSLILTTGSARSDYYADSEKSLLASLKLSPKSFLCNYLLGVLYQKKGDYDVAIKYFSSATVTNEFAFELLCAEANCLIKLNRASEVSSITDKLLVQYPSNLRVLKLCAETSFLLKDYLNAEKYASLVLQQNPSDLEFVLFRAKIFVATGDYLKASSLLDVYARSNRPNKDYLLCRARVQKEWNKNYSAASSTIEDALARYPNDSDVILFAAEIASETGNAIMEKDGGTLAEDILKSEPNNTEALSFLIRNLMENKKWTEAYNTSIKLLSLDNSIERVCTHIKICLNSDKTDEAWKRVSELYAKNPNSDSVVQIYIEVMIKANRTAQALRLINSMITTASSNMKSFLFYERSFLVSGENAKLSDLRSSLMSNPRNSDSLFRMYEIYFGKKDYRKAQYYLKQVLALDSNNREVLRLNSELEHLID